MELAIEQQLNAISHDAIRAKSKNEIQQLANELLQKMTLTEKIGQLFQLAPPEANVEGLKWEHGESNASAQLISAGKVGSILSVVESSTIFKLQKLAVDNSRLGIPLFFAADMIHGCRTGFPINLAMACSFDPELIEKSCQQIAYEIAHTGLNLTFSPMVDLVRDPRWGRVMESNGEDPYLNSQLAAAYVRGYQQGDFSANYSVAACCKHFAAYGAIEGGREYNTVDMSERELRQHYLPGYKACADAGVASFMTSFNIYDGVPATANKFLLRDILRNEWQYQGFAISDYTSSYEMLDHKTAKDEEDVALQCILAGLDHEMVSTSYLNHLENLVNAGKVSLDLINEAVLRMLQFKFQIGLFDNPYKHIYANPEQYMRNSETLKLAHQAALESVVLLRNKHDLLPLSKQGKKIALIGPFANSNQVVGAWGSLAKDAECVSLLTGISSLVGADALLCTAGCAINDQDRSGFAEALELAKQADVVILALGEDQNMSGEAKSRAYLNIPGVQNELALAIKALNKPMVSIIFSGRPLELGWYAEHSDAILQAWFLGNESGNALASLLFGDANPSAKLAMSFPYTVGQIPVYYNQYKTGRPSPTGEYSLFRSCYIDVPNYPLFSFGFGLSYSKFEYKNLKVSEKTLVAAQQLIVSVELCNTSVVAGAEVVQLYIECTNFSVVRPQRELKAFKRVFLEQNSCKIVEFTLTQQDLAYYNIDMKFTPENRDYVVYVGGSSQATLNANFSYSAED